MRALRFGWMVAAFTASACVRSDTTMCGDEVCPAGTACATVTTEQNTTQMRCARPDQFAACDDHADGDACDLGGAANATCNGGACFADLCGDGVRGSVEACDDANIESGDGCSSDCRSAEVCGNGIVDPLKNNPGPPPSKVLNELCDDGNSLAHDGCAVCELEAPKWIQIPVPKPSFRAYQGMVFDTRRHEIVMEGGSNEVSETPTDTWVWNGIGWHQRPLDVEPPGRSSSGLVYDSARDRLVIFGGSDSSFSVPVSDLWEWDGARWSERVSDTGGPTARFDHAMVYDAIRHETLVIGGLGYVNSTTDYLAETWAWDGTSWTQKLPPTPADALPKRARASAAFDPVRGETVLFGGGDNTGIVAAETWLFDGTRWRRAAPAQSPSARMGAAMAWDPTSQRVIMFGGSSTGALSDTWAWDGSNWTPIPTTSGPSARFAAAMSSDFERGGVVMYGGALTFNASKRDTWWWNGTAWVDQTATFEPRLLETGAAYASKRDTIVVFGGQSGAIEATTRLCVHGIWFDATGTTGQPTARRRPSMVYDPVRDRVVMWGGTNPANQPIDDGTWAWDGEWHQIAPANTPTARVAPALAYDAARDEIVMFGGVTGSVNTTDETWVFDGTTWTKRTPAMSPPPRYFASLGYDPVRQVTVMVGGQSANALFSDLWTWDGTNWTRLSPLTRPPAHSGATLSWNESRQRLLLAGGYDVNGSPARDAWELDGDVWTQVLVQSAPVRGSITMIGTPTGMLRLSGSDVVEKPDVWRLRWESTAPDEVCHSPKDLDGDGLVGCQDPDCDAVCAECGDGTCQAFESCRICPQDCGACADFCGDTACGQAESATSCPSDC